jgi:hypothetical protein
MKATFSLLLIFALTNCFAQTRRIAHRAHSGSNTERYVKGDGNYGYYPPPQKVTVHLESGRDSLVYEWDTLANPRFYLDTVPHPNYRPIDKRPKEDIRQMGKVTGRLILTGRP